MLLLLKFVALLKFLRMIHSLSCLDRIEEQVKDFFCLLQIDLSIFGSFQAKIEFLDIW